MKRLNAIATCLFFALIMISCGEDDPAENPIVNELNDEWKVTSFTFEVTSTSSVLGIEFSTTSNGVGKDLEYTLNLDDGNFTTSGDYSIEVVTTGVGIIDPIPTSQTYTDVSGSGTYTTTDDQIMIDGQFFEFELEGMSFSETTGPSSATYVVDGNVLTVSQDEEMTSVTSGVENSIILKSTSIWSRQ